jgi:SAM-dependent methyltransferase
MCEVARDRTVVVVERNRARSFGTAAEAYARHRPGYPAAAVDWALAPLAGRAHLQLLDLAAGTGKLTESLLPRGTVTAVEPDPAMLAELRARVPGVDAREGSAEDIPLPDGCVDAVLVGQAWHWFDLERAYPEIARVLRPGGRLGVAWNVRDHRVAWVDRYTEIIHRGDTLDPFHGEPTLDDRFGEVEQATFEWRHRMPVEDLATLAASRSNVLTMPEHERAELLAEIAELARTHPDLAGRDVVEMPYRTTCWRASLR